MNSIVRLAVSLLPARSLALSTAQADESPPEAK
jgi:hypothetical protein